VNYLQQHKYFLQINRLPEITVYTCNYNTGKYIKDLMDSIYSQSYDDYEFIIMDDCSTDDSLNIITEYYTGLNPVQQHKTKVLRNDENMGLPASCNKVLEMSRGKFVIRVDSDDVLEPDALLKMRNAMMENSVQAVLSGYYETDEDLNITGKVITNQWHPAGCMLSRWCVNELKYREDLKYLEGADFFKSFREANSLHFIPEPLWKYRSRPGQKTRDVNHPNTR